MNRQQTNSYPTTDATAQFLRQMIAQQQQQHQQPQPQITPNFSYSLVQKQQQQQQQHQMSPGSLSSGLVSNNASYNSKIQSQNPSVQSTPQQQQQQNPYLQQQLQMMRNNQQQPQGQSSILHQSAYSQIQKNSQQQQQQIYQLQPNQQIQQPQFQTFSPMQSQYNDSAINNQVERGPIHNSFQHQSQSLTSSVSGSLSANQNFKVVIRVRPPLPRELSEQVDFQPITNITPDSKSCHIQEYLGAEITEYGRQRDIKENPHIVTSHQFSFDYVYGPDSTQSHVYENTARPAVLSVLEGYNATILAYGQTGTGKTYTMEGFKYHQNDPQRGIIPRAMEEIFRYIQNGANMHTTFMVRASYLQIYNENISDLLKTERSSLSIREDKKRGVFVEGLSEWAVRTPHEIYSLMQRGAMVRATAATKMNDVSSRSHAVFIMIVEQMNMSQDMNNPGELSKQIKVGKLNLVDLAGSERVRVTGATGKRLEECKKINQSLSALGNVIAALTDMKARNHIPYRDSKLTRLLEDSLGGNCKTTMMAMVSPAFDSFSESLSTLKFATRAKKIKNEARINEDVDQRALLRKYENELKKLREELELRSQNVVDKESILRLEQQKRRAEEDKIAAITALETRSREFMIEKEEKKKLEEKIKMLNSQLLVGGKKIEDTPQFKSALEEKQRLIRQEYEGKLSELERERQQIEEDKAQVDRYKQLLLKQRDIMIALTARLNERDETIIQLQEELDAYERIHRETESMVDKKQDRIMQLEQVMQSRGIEIPYDEEGADRPVLHQNSNFDTSGVGQAQANGGMVVGQEQARKYPPQEQYHLEDDDMPLQLLTADEKVEELSNILAHKDNELDSLRVQLQGAIRPEQLKDRIDSIVHREVEERVKMINADSGSSDAATRNLTLSSSNQQQVQYMEKKLKIAEEKNDALKNLLSSKDDELERILQQKVALTNLFENDLLQMTDKLISGSRQVRTQDELSQMSNDLINLQKLIAVSFQALKGSMATKPQSNNINNNNANNMPRQNQQPFPKKQEKENSSHTGERSNSSRISMEKNVIHADGSTKIPQAIDQMLNQRYLIQQQHQQLRYN